MKSPDVGSTSSIWEILSSSPYTLINTLDSELLGGMNSRMSPLILNFDGSSSKLSRWYWAMTSFSATSWGSNSSPTLKVKARSLYSVGSVKPKMDATVATTIVSCLSSKELTAAARIISNSWFIWTLLSMYVSVFGI